MHYDTPHKTSSSSQRAPMNSVIEYLNFVITNYIPRAAASRVMGKLSKIESPLFTRIALKIWQFFADDMHLDEAEKDEFKSLHDCFTRRLKEGARPLRAEHDIITSPCDAILGAHGHIVDNQVLQIKGSMYDLNDLVKDTIDLEKYRGGRYVTLRIKSSMYHHIHAPVDCNLKQIHYIAGDTWNVNPPTLRRVPELFCKNERACLELELNNHEGHITLIPVAAVLVASMRFEGLEHALDLQYKGANTLPCNRRFSKGDRMGWFEHGSTVILLASKHFQFSPTWREGNVIRMGEALLRTCSNLHQSSLPVSNTLKTNHQIKT